MPVVITIMIVESLVIIQDQKVKMSVPVSQNRVSNLLMVLKLFKSSPKCHGIETLCAD